MFKPPLGAQINFGHSLAQQLAAAYILSEGSGQVHEAANRGSVGVVTGSPTWAPGQGGLQLKSFTTGSGYIDFGANVPTQDLMLGDVSIVAWVTDGFTQGAKVDGIIAGKNDGNNSAGWAFGINSSGTALWELTVIGSGNGHLTATKLTASSSITAPTMVVMTCPKPSTSMAGGLIYQNGIALTTTTGNASGTTTDAANPLRFGDYPAYRGGFSGSCFNGNIISLLFYRRVLMPAEISQLYLSPYCFMQGAQPVSRFYLGTAPPAFYNASVSDSVATSDPLQIIAGGAYNPSVNDSSTVTESATSSVENFISVSDSASVTEATVEQTAYALSVSDSITGTEALSVTSKSIVNVFDNISISESINIAPPPLSLLVSDVESVSDRVYVQRATETVLPSPATGGGSLRNMPARTILKPNFPGLSRPRILR